MTQAQFRPSLLRTAVCCEITDGISSLSRTPRLATAGKRRPLLAFEPGCRFVRFCQCWFRLKTIGPTQRVLYFSIQSLLSPGGPLRVVVILIVHAMKRQRFNPPALADVKIGVLVPADGIQKKIAHKTHGFRRQLSRRERQGEFIAAVQKHERIVAFPDQFVHRAIARAPAGGRAPPGRFGPELVVNRRERQRGGQRSEVAETPPVQITVPGNQSGLMILIRRNLSHRQAESQ